MSSSSVAIVEKHSTLVKALNCHFIEPSKGYETIVVGKDERRKHVLHNIAIVSCCKCSTKALSYSGIFKT